MPQALLKRLWLTIHSSPPRAPSRAIRAQVVTQTIEARMTRNSAFSAVATPRPNPRTSGEFQRTRTPRIVEDPHGLLVPFNIRLVEPKDMIKVRRGQLVALGN